MAQQVTLASKSESQNPEPGHLSPRAKELSWEQSLGKNPGDHRNGSFSAPRVDGELEEQDKSSPVNLQDSALSIEERLSMIEKEMSQLLSTSGPTRTFSEFGHGQGMPSEIDFARYVPKNEVVRVPSDQWHDTKQGRFAVPEPSVLTVSNTGRYWAGRNTATDTQHGIDSNKMDEAHAKSTALAEDPPERPYRLAVNGYELLRALEIIIGRQISSSNNVWIWPFKHFIRCEAQIRQRLKAEERLLEEMRPARDMGSEGDKSESGPEFAHVRSIPSGSNLEQYGQEALEQDEKYGAATRLRNQLLCLVEFMDEDMKDLFRVKREIANGTLEAIGFDYLWLLYKPGDLIFSGTTQRRAYRVLHVTGGRAILDIGEQPAVGTRSSEPKRSWDQHEDQAVTYAHSKNTPFVIDCFYIDFDGENFGPVPRRFVVQEFAGEQPINSLKAFPAKFDKNFKETEKMLLRRGKRFAKFAGVNHKKYVGLSAREPSMADYQEEVNSDVVIDFAEGIKKFRKDNPGWDVGLGEGVVDKPTRADSREINEIKPCPTKGCTLCKESDIFDDSYHDLWMRSDFLDATSMLRYRAFGKEDLDMDQILLLPPRVYGYSLLDRRWYPLNIDLVQDIKASSSNGFDDLVLPGDHKRIMQALVKHHTRGSRPTSGRSKTPTDFSMDLVRGKGRGLIILLHGVPGVGKTSTAECVAAQTKRPLFPITCGDIGTTATEVETRLESYFDLAHKWGCVLLLDEADVYLASRERGGDLQRNSLVSVFLRVLEYYSGILILTTNRVAEFDEAFKSRIHISLYYPKLDRESTIKIWDMNLKRLLRSDLDMDVDEEKILKFAKSQWYESKKKLTRRWNGRQIKNAFQTAIALATWDFNDESEGAHLDRPRLSDKQFRIVSQTSAHFDDYISAVHGIDEDDAFAVLAEREALRKDDVPRADWNGRRESQNLQVKPLRTIRGGSRHESSEDERLENSDSDQDNIQELELQLKLEKMRSRRKSSVKENTEDRKDRRQDPPVRRSKVVVENSSEKSDDE